MINRRDMTMARPPLRPSHPRPSCADHVPTMCRRDARTAAATVTRGKGGQPRPPKRLKNLAAGQKCTIFTYFLCKNYKTFILDNTIVILHLSTDDRRIFITALHFKYAPLFPR